MERFQLSLMICGMATFASGGTALAQDSLSPSYRFGRDTLAPLIASTIEGMQKYGGFEAPIPGEDAQRGASCHALAGQMKSFRELYAIRQTGLLNEEAAIGVAHRLGMTIRDVTVRDLLNRCRHEAERACRSRGDAMAVVQAVQSMSMIRSAFWELDIPPSGVSAAEGSFKRPVGDDDRAWMARTLDRCARFEVSWRSQHRHECPDLPRPWGFKVEARALLAGKIEDFSLNDASSFDAKITYRVVHSDTQLQPQPPGDVGGGISTAYNSVRVTRPAEFTIEQFDASENSQTRSIALVFRPPEIKEDIYVRGKGVNIGYVVTHWFKGFLSVYAAKQNGETLRLDVFQGKTLTMQGIGTGLDEAKECLPHDQSRFEIEHKPE